MIEIEYTYLVGLFIGYGLGIITGLSIGVWLGVRRLNKSFDKILNKLK